MPKMDDILRSAEENTLDRIQENSMDSTNNTIQRPWHGLNSNLEDRLEPIIEDWRKRPDFTDELSGDVIPLWYSSFTKIVQAIDRQKIKLFITFLLAFSLTGLLASLIPSTYFSTLHLYAPEKTDSVSSRLQLFSNKIEFASFPIDFKIPLGLIARRLKSGAAKAWVLKNYYETQNNLTDKKINEDLVHADTFYAEGSELLVIEGYANDPEIAVEITNLYWAYLENEIKSLHEENLTKVQKWINLTSSDWSQRLDSISNQLSQMPTGGFQDGNGSLRFQLSSDFSSLELKKRKLSKELSDLRFAAKSKDTATLWSLPEPEIQDLRRVDEALKGFSNQDKNHDDLVARARDILQHRLTEKESELSALSEQMQQVNRQISERASASRAESSVTSKQTDLLRQQSDYAGRLEDLEKLKNQIEVESTLSHKKLSPIQAAFADPSTRRPSMIVKYSIAVLAALFLTVLTLVILESQFAYKIRMALQ